MPWRFFLVLFLSISASHQNKIDTQELLQQQQEKLLMEQEQLQLQQERLHRLQEQLERLNPPPSNKPSTGSNLNHSFSIKLLPLIAIEFPQRNIVYSPLALGTSMAFIYLGTEEKTAAELQKALKLPASKEEVINIFQEIIKPQKTSTETQLIMGNKLYHGFDLTVNGHLKDVVAAKFDVELDGLNFTDANAVNVIMNSWGALKTQNRVKNLVGNWIKWKEWFHPTSAVLMSAYYFKGKWLKPMSLRDTRKENFFFYDEREQPVDMMKTEDIFRYANFPDLQAQIIELPYRNSDMSMMVILSYDKKGLDKLEESIVDVDLNVLADRLKPQLVEVQIPRFSFDFDRDMREPLQRIGVDRILESNSQSGGIFQPPPNRGLGRIHHKGHIEVNEAGSDVTPTSFTKLCVSPRPFISFTFIANHPFVFVIRSPRTVHLVGHVKQF